VRICLDWTLAALAPDDRAFLLQHHPYYVAQRLADTLAVAIAQLAGTPDVKHTFAGTKVLKLAERLRADPPAEQKTHSTHFQRYAPYRGWKKGVFDEVSFDSNDEGKLAILLDSPKNKEIVWWLHLLKDELTIGWAGPDKQHEYNPDFLVLDIHGEYWILEMKGGHLKDNADTQAKRESAESWTNAVEVGMPEPRWHYRFIPDDVLDALDNSWSALVTATQYLDAPNS
jgi:hypothetical protein